MTGMRGADAIGAVGLLCLIFSLIVMFAYGLVGLYESSLPILLKVAATSFAVGVLLLGTAMVSK